jgi:hypothetical protein
MNILENIDILITEAENKSQTKKAIKVVNRILDHIKNNNVAYGAATGAAITAAFTTYDRLQLIEFVENIRDLLNNDRYDIEPIKDWLYNANEISDAYKVPDIKRVVIEKYGPKLAELETSISPKKLLIDFAETIGIGAVGGGGWSYGSNKIKETLKRK